jgi:hypothetical protein
MSVLGKIRTMMRTHHYEVFDRPYELNIVGLRSTSTKPNKFDDEIHVFFKTVNGSWEHYVFTATTDPGTYWLYNPMMPQGTAILAMGQYKNAYHIGLHRGEYYALTQIKPVKVIRDYNRDAKLDFLNGYFTTGLYGINIHRALRYGVTKIVDKFSAGCQVFEDANDFNLFMGLCERHKQLYGNFFTYTLLDYRALLRASIKRWTIGIATTVITGIICFPFIKELFQQHFLVRDEHEEERK